MALSYDEFVRRPDVFVERLCGALGKTFDAAAFQAVRAGVEALKGQGGKLVPFERGGSRLWDLETRVVSAYGALVRREVDWLDWAGAPADLDPPRTEDVERLAELCDPRPIAVSR